MSQAKCFKSLNGLLADDDRTFFDKVSSKVILSANQMVILGVNIDKKNLDDDNNNFDEDDSDTIIYIRLLAW